MTEKTKLDQARDMLRARSQETAIARAQYEDALKAEAFAAGAFSVIQQMEAARSAASAPSS